MIFQKPISFEGRNLRFHLIVDRVLDFEAKTIKPIIWSWSSREAAEANRGDAIPFTTTVEFDEWDPMLLVNLEPLVVGLDWEPNKVGYTPPPEKTLEELKAEKSLELDLAASGQIYLGYDSDALGVVHHYPAKDKDQTNMVASVTDSYNPANPVDWTTPFWCEDSEGVWAYRMHTATQIQKAGSDGKLAILASLGKNAYLQSLVLAAATVEDLAAITWDA